MGYYLGNFETLLAQVEEQYTDLLDVDESRFLGDFRRLSLNARRLHGRLLTRRGPWFRRDRLHYPEIDSDAAASELLAADFAQSASEQDVEPRLALLPRAELLELIDVLAPGNLAAVAFGIATAQPVPPPPTEPPAGPIARQLRLPPSSDLPPWRAPDAGALETPSSRARSPQSRRFQALGRADLAAQTLALVRAHGAEASLAERVPLLRLSRIEAVATFRLLFFGNLIQDLTEFVLADLGVVRFEPVAIDREHRLFAHRGVVEQHLRLARLTEAVAGLAQQRQPPAAALGELAAAALAMARGEDSWDLTTRRLRDGLFVWVGRELERAGALDDALALFAAAHSPPARERRVRVLRRLGRADEAEALRDAMAAAPRDESERIFCQRGPRDRRLERPRLPSREVAIALHGEEPTIEAAVLRTLSAEGYRGFFAENWLWRSLCGLALWEQVFAPVPGAFTHRFQYGPRDLHDGFRAAREPAISARLAALAAEPHPGPRLLALWDEKFGTANRLVAFAQELRPALELALDALDGTRLAAVVDRLSRDLRRYGSGFPDLFLLDPRGEILLAEVKGPGDVLRPEQEGWIAYFNRSGIPAIVLHARCPRDRAPSR